MNHAVPVPNPQEAVLQSELHALQVPNVLPCIDDGSRRSSCTAICQAPGPGIVPAGMGAVSTKPGNFGFAALVLVPCALELGVWTNFQTASIVISGIRFA